MPGIYHVVGDDVCSPFQVASKIAVYLGASDAMVQKTSFASFLKDVHPDLSMRCLVMIK